MGDTLKDCCEVMGVTDCLSKVLVEIQAWMQKYGSRATATSVPHWQELEAPIFALRAMGRMVDKQENIVLRQLMPLLVQIPPHEKLRFATIMVFARYTEWTSAHPDFLEPQFTYIVSSFQTDSQEILRAAAQSIKFFCTDCSALLSGQVLQLHSFYNQILDKLPEMSQEEMTEGVATVVAAQKNEDIYRLLKLYCDPLVARLMTKANNATDDQSKLAVAGMFPPRETHGMDGAARMLTRYLCSRPYPVNLLLHPDCRALRATGRGEPCGQVLAGGFPRPLDRARQLPQLHPHL